MPTAELNTLSDLHNSQAVAAQTPLDTAPAETQTPPRMGAPGFRSAPKLSDLIIRDASRNALAREWVNPFAPLRDEILSTSIENTSDLDLRAAYRAAYEGERLTPEQGLLLLTKGDLLLLGGLATRAKERFHPGRSATYLLDRNINYTNVCRIGCDFCAFYRKDGDSDAYVLKDEVIHEKIAETIRAGGTGVLLQGGVNPHLKIGYYEDLFRSIKARFDIHLHALSVIEIEGIARVSRLTIDETLQRLQQAGLDSIPGAGAEILVDEIRLDQSPVKRHAHRWIDVMKAAHRHDLPTTATMMFGALEKPRHIIEHIMRIRDAQDETKGFYAFIMWTFQGENTELREKHPDLQPTSAVEYLKVVAVSRLMMDNIPNIQGSWVTMGPKVGQTALHFGANDMGSIMMEENVVSAAGTMHQMDEQGMRKLIHRSGFIAVQRDTYYNHLAEHPFEEA
jgi:cyclic dehypoxanthinyl futalosine synthase